jgi:hypothetical protein
MVLLGWAVRHGSTPVDDWFHRYGRGPAHRLLFFTDPRVFALVVLVAGVAWWAVLVAVGWCLLGIVGQAVTYHYFTDTVGALLLGTAIVCVVALALGHTPHPT